MDFDIEVEGDKYELLYDAFGNIGITAHKLKIIYDRDENNKFYEEIEGEASFLQDIKLGYENSKFKLSITKANRNLEESARLNIKEYLTNDQLPEDYGLNECIQTGFSRLSMNGLKLSCRLILEDSVFDKLLLILSSNNLTGFGFYANYLCIYKMLKTNENKEYYEAAEIEKDIYIFPPKGAMYPGTTFGAITRLFIDSNSVLINQPYQKEDAHPIEISPVELSMINLIRHTGIMANTLIIGFIAIFLLLMFK
ncbi:hypothetical protein MCERHM32_00161 [Methylophilaceae bacterium]